jgi:DNA-binding NarL/FixJ family response regulator
MSAAPMLNVLLIEDSPLIRRSLIEAIDATGSARVGAFADSAAAALRVLDDQPFDAVIVDLQLREGSGIEVLAHLQRRKMLDSTLAVVLTNHALPTYRQRCAQYGAHHFFDKSLEFDRVIEVLEQLATQAARRPPEK